MRSRSISGLERFRFVIFGTPVLLMILLAHLWGSHYPGFRVRRALAAEVAGRPLHNGEAQPSGTGTPSITVDYPEDGSIFPPEITAPTFLWRDANNSATAWRIDVTFMDGFPPIRINSRGDPMQIGEIDSRCVSANNELPSLTPQQVAAHTWMPDAATWTTIKQHSVEHPATVLITGLHGIAPHATVSVGRTTLTTSKDPVGAPIFYRDVPLMPSVGEKGVVQPLAQDALHLINWRLRDIGQSQSRVVLHDMPTCANCHSFSGDGKTMGMDVDGPRNDKGLYAVVPVRQQTSIRNEDVVAWNTDQIVGQSRVGFMSQISPDGKYVLTTFAGPQQDLPSSYYVTNFKDYRFLQVFYPTRGILVWYNRATGRRQPLPGADDSRYVQTDGVWSPDGKYIVFARADAKDPFLDGQKAALHANDENETQIQYDLYRIPFNGGKGGTPEPIAGASQNGMSNNFPKVSPDGRWIIFVKCRNGQLMRPDSELYIVAVTGGVARRMRCNTSLMNSWHSFSPNGHWLVFSSKSRSPYTQMFLTHIGEQGEDSPAIYVDGSTAANRAVNIPEFVNIAPNGLQKIVVPAADFYRVVDRATTLLEQGKNPEALVEWQRAVTMQTDDAGAHNGLAIALYVQGDFDQAAAHFRRANQIDPSSIGDARAQCYLGLMYHDGQGVRQDYGQALDLFGKAAGRSYALAQYYLGAMYGNGQGVPQDYSQAATWYRKAADQGFVNAQFLLGSMYHDGQGVQQDYAEAMALFHKAADHGNAQAQYDLGGMYEYGQGTPQDSAHALEWYHKAAEQGIVPAQEKLGAIYGGGQGVRQDYVEAAAWYRKAAEQGSANAQFLLGAMYRSGQGVTRNDAQAIEWVRKAAEQGTAQAQYYLGVMYGNGQGVQQDYAQAAAWYRKAADQGSANAQFLLGVMCHSGQGVRRDLAEAYYLLNLAAACNRDEKNSNTFSQARDNLANELPAEQLILQQDRASKWLNSHSCR